MADIRKFKLSVTLVDDKGNPIVPTEAQLKKRAELQERSTKRSREAKKKRVAARKKRALPPMTPKEKKRIAIREAVAAEHKKQAAAAPKAPKGKSGKKAAGDADA